ncbi:MAG TPA: TerB family tellurite resistance protein [Niastella sp.]
MYTGLLKAPEEGVCHLFYYCCMKDGSFKESELNTISDKLVSIDLHKKLNFKDEMQKYKSYVNGITDEDIYLQYLISIIKPQQPLALFSWCIELCAADGEVSAEEDALLTRIARLLNIGDTEKDLLQRLIIQRKIVAVEKEF